MAVHASSQPKGFCFIQRFLLELRANAPVLVHREPSPPARTRHTSKRLPPFNRSLRSGSSLGLMAMRWSGPVQR
jgi:hypothetical protein